MSRCFGASQVSSPSSSSISASLTISFSMYPEMIIFLKITLFVTKYNKTFFTYFSFHFFTSSNFVNKLSLKSIR